MDKEIPQNIIFCIPQMKVSLSGLEWHEDDRISFNRFWTSPTSFQLATTLAAHLVYILLFSPDPSVTSLSHPIFISFCFTCRFSLATATTTCTKRTCWSPPSTHDSSASCRGRGMNALPCEWSCWAATSRTPPSLFSPSPLLYFPHSFFPLPRLHCLTLSNRGHHRHTTLHSWGPMSQQLAANEAQTHSVTHLTLNILY